VMHPLNARTETRDHFCVVVLGLSNDHDVTSSRAVVVSRIDTKIHLFGIWVGRCLRFIRPVSPRRVSQHHPILKTVTPGLTTPTVSHTGQVLSRAVTFQFALDPNAEQKILLAKCAGARRYTVNHHLARVKANLDARSTERECCRSVAIPANHRPLRSPGQPSLSSTNSTPGRTDSLTTRWINDDGTRGLVWRHELPGDVFECASVDAAQALENFAASRRGQRSGSPVGFPRFQAKGKVTPSFRLRNRATPGRAPSSQPIRFSDPSHLRLPKFGPVKLFGPTRKVSSHDRCRSLPRVLSHPHPARRRLDGVADWRGGPKFTRPSAVASQSSRRSRRCRSGNHLPLRRRRRERCSLQQLRGGENTEASARVAQGSQSGPGQNHTGVPKAANERGPDSPSDIAKSPTLDDTSSTRLPGPWWTSCQVLVIEDLNVAGMVRNRHLARSISDAAMGELSRQLLYKARWHGVEVRVADRFFPSSKTCSGCGDVRKDLDLSTRTYSCEVCGLVIDRDLNAAINLARWQPKKPSEVTLLDPTPALLLSTA
jgi:putative transposase